MAGISCLKGETYKDDKRNRINRVDKEGGQFMTHAERNCRKLKSGRICFSPESVIWIKREQIYRSLVEYKHGRTKNSGNLKMAAWVQGTRSHFKYPWHNSGSIWRCVKSGMITFVSTGQDTERSIFSTERGKPERKEGRKQLSKFWRS